MLQVRAVKNHPRIERFSVRPTANHNTRGQMQQFFTRGKADRSSRRKFIGCVLSEVLLIFF